MARLICAGAMCAAMVAAEPLSQHDRDYALSLLHSTRKQFLDSIAGLSTAQLNFKAGPDRWSIMEVAEHIDLSEHMFTDMRTKIMAAPADPSKKAEDKVTDDEQIEKFMTDRSHKVQAPEVLRPQHKFTNIQEIIADFKTARDANLDYVRTTQDDLRSHYANPMGNGYMDAYQWILVMAGHSERHTMQILEVKADPNFPKQ